MKEVIRFLKGQKAGFWLVLAAILCGIAGVAVFLAAVNVSEGAFYNAYNVQIIICLVAAVAMSVALIVLGQIANNRAMRFVADGVAVLSTLLFALVLVLILAASVYELAIYFGSSLDSSNEAVAAAMRMYFPALVLTVIALLASMAKSFFSVAGEKGTPSGAARS